MAETAWLALLLIEVSKSEAEVRRRKLFTVQGAISRRSKNYCRITDNKALQFKCGNTYELFNIYYVRDAFVII